MQQAASSQITTSNDELVLTQGKVRLRSIEVDRSIRSRTKQRPHRRPCDVMMSHRRRYDTTPTSCKSGPANS